MQADAELEMIFSKEYNNDFNRIMNRKIGEANKYLLTSNLYL